MGWYVYYKFDILLQKNYSYNVEEISQKLNKVDSFEDEDIPDYIPDMKNIEKLELPKTYSEFAVSSPRIGKLHIEMCVKRGTYELLEEVTSFLQRFFLGNIREIKERLVPQGSYACSQLY